MRKYLSVLVALLLAFSMYACTENTAPATTAPMLPTSPPADNKPITNYVVPNPMKYPDYTFSEPPTTEQLRQMAIQGMRDLLSIQWHTAIEIAYKKTGPVSGKHFKHSPDNTYAGTIYSNASTGIFQFMEFYDQETGLFSYPGNVNQLKEAVGNSCADSLLWGWSTVCNSITGGFFPSTMVYKNGYLPVGNYTYDYTISTYNKLPSYKIIESNGKDVILDAYTKVLPADAFVSTSDNHAMMVIEKPYVVYTADGKIDTTASYVMIQDQRGGSGAGFYDQTVDGHVYHYSGRTSHKFTFAELLEKHYIPVTTAEFIGSKPYDKAALTVSNTACKNIEELLEVKISSNYPLAIIRGVITDSNGKETIVDRRLFGGASDMGVPRAITLNQIKWFREFDASKYTNKGNSFKIEVVVSTGETFTIANIAL